MIKYLVLAVTVGFASTTALASDIAEKFASISAGQSISSKDALVERADKVLSRLAVKCRNTREQVADTVAKGQSMLRKKGIEQDLLTMAEGMLYAAQKKCADGNITDLTTYYIGLRTLKGQSHHEAIERLRAAIDQI